MVDGDEVPPIVAPSGKDYDGQPAGAKAYVLSYVYDPNESERFIGYLEKYTSEGKKIISFLREPENEVTKELVQQLNKNRFVRRLVDEQWFLADSNEGRYILEQVSVANKAGQIPNYCSPKQHMDK